MERAEERIGGDTVEKHTDSMRKEYILSRYEAKFTLFGSDVNDVNGNVIGGQLTAD